MYISVNWSVCRLYFTTVGKCWFWFLSLWASLTSDLILLIVHWRVFRTIVCKIKGNKYQVKLYFFGVSFCSAAIKLPSNYTIPSLTHLPQVICGVVEYWYFLNYPALPLPLQDYPKEQEIVAYILNAEKVTQPKPRNYWNPGISCCIVSTQATTSLCSGRNEWDSLVG